MQRGAAEDVQPAVNLARYKLLSCLGCALAQPPQYCGGCEGVLYTFSGETLQFDPVFFVARGKS